MTKSKVFEPPTPPELQLQIDALTWLAEQCEDSFVKAWILAKRSKLAERHGLGPV